MESFQFLYIKVLYLSLGDGSHEIPENDLNYFVFESNKFDITRIEKNVFSKINNLFSLSFDDILIRSIPAKPFNFMKNSTQKLDINFINCNLYETSLEEGVFSDAKRPLILDLSMN